MSQELNIRELSRQIVVKVARDTASILHTRNDLRIEESEFCDEAEALATGEECGCMEPEEAIEGSLMVWVEKQLATHSDAHLLRSHEATLELLRQWRMNQYPRDHAKYCRASVKYLDWDEPKDDRCDLCKRTDAALTEAAALTEKEK